MQIYIPLGALFAALATNQEVHGFTVSQQKRFHPRSSSFIDNPCSGHRERSKKINVKAGQSILRERFDSSSLSSSSSSSSLPDLVTEKSVKHICVLGGGFGGLNTALTLASFQWPKDDKTEIKITLVDQKERFVFLPLLYELCVGDAELDEVAPTFKNLLQNTEIEFLQGSVRGVDKDHSNVYITPAGNGRQTNEEKKISYDSLILATGASVNLSITPGAQKYALPFYTVEDCFELRKRLSLIDSLQASSSSTGGDESLVPTNVVIVGGGYSGVELALNLSERLGGSKRNVNVTLVHRGKQPLQYASEFNRKTALDRLEKSGVTVMTETNVVEVCESDDESNSFDSSDGTIPGKCKVFLEQKNNGSNEISSAVDADILLWTAGATSTNVPKGILNSKLPRDSSGRVVTNNLLRVKDTSNVFALGDCARSRKVPYGATAAVAMQQAPVVAWNVYATIMSEIERGGNDSKEQSLLKFSYVNLGEMMTLGSSDATLSSLDGLLQLSGSSASILRRLIYAVRMPTAEQALTAALSSSKNKFSSAFTSLEGKKWTSNVRKE